ncbi:MAG: lysogenic protein, partial [Acidobacteria bacterium]|nr:lysogenic protein [Acidobacteriota bacterium]
QPLRESVDEMARNLSSGKARLIELQHALVDLIEYLDPNYVRFDKNRCQKA